MTLTLESKAAQKVCEQLSELLANSYTLLLKTQNYHWNVIDPRFSELHKLFETQVDELFEQVDQIAERIRMLGHRAPGTMAFFLENATLDEATGHSTGDEMIQTLARDHQSLSNWLQSKIPETQKLNDEGTADLYIELLRAHQKQSWMLLSHHHARG